jgi:hypothetical protein
MLYAQMPYSFKEAMFAEAHAMGMRSIRVSIELPALIVDSAGQRDWRGLDEYIALARKYDMDVTATLYATPWWLADCPPGVPFEESYRCPTRDTETWAGYVSEIVEHADGRISSWEVLNEPDGSWAYLGTPAQYAALLRATYPAIKRADPNSQVLIGGAMSLASQPWIDDVLDELGDDAGASFDVANIHVRGELDELARKVRSWRSFYREHGYVGPLWVTEHGYPSDPRYQDDPRFQAGTSSQASYLEESLPALLRAGAARVFVTERDNLEGKFASEGVLGGTVLDPVPAIAHIDRKPAVEAVAAAVAAGIPTPSQTASRRGAFGRSAPTPTAAAVTFTADGRGTARDFVVRWLTTCDDGRQLIRRASFNTVPLGTGYEGSGAIGSGESETITWSLDGRFVAPHRARGRWAATVYLREGETVTTCRAAPLHWSARRGRTRSGRARPSAAPEEPALLESRDQREEGIDGQ